MFSCRYSVQLLIFVNKLNCCKFDNKVPKTALIPKYSILMVNYGHLLFKTKFQVTQVLCLINMLICSLFVMVKKLTHNKVISHIITMKTDSLN